MAASRVSADLGGPSLVVLSGSERGPVALPVFKIGRSPLTRGGWVRLPGASANLHSGTGIVSRRVVVEFPQRRGAERATGILLKTDSRPPPSHLPGLTS